MNYAVTISQAESTYLAAVRATVNRQTLGATIRQLLTRGEVYQFIKKAGITKAGHNVIIYRNDQQKVLGNGQTEFVIEVGVQVEGPFEEDDQVVCSSTPHGSVATTLHTGPYDRLGQAHTAVMNWAKEQNLPLTGLSWEVYGDWEEDPNKLTTQVYYLLK